MGDYYSRAAIQISGVLNYNYITLYKGNKSQKPKLIKTKLQKQDKNAEKPKNSKSPPSPQHVFQGIISRSPESNQLGLI